MPGKISGKTTLGFIDIQDSPPSHPFPMYWNHSRYTVGGLGQAPGNGNSSQQEVKGGINGHSSHFQVRSLYDRPVRTGTSNYPIQKVWVTLTIDLRQSDY
ncbi:unnamed protein product [Caretta caretta]